MYPGLVSITDLGHQTHIMLLLLMSPKVAHY